MTGAAGGIGSASARYLAAEGARLLLADRAMAPLEALAAQISDAGFARPALALHDAGENDGAKALIEAALSAHGQLDGLCNIAGMHTRKHSHLVSDADWALMMQVNLGNVFALTREALPHLQRSGGSVVSISSLAALDGLAYSTAYAVSKAGVIALTKSLAAEYAASGVRLNVICPGAVRSGMSGAPSDPEMDPDLSFRRSKLKGLQDGYGQPEDIASAIAFLLSSEARYISGSVLVIDGAQFLI